MSRDRVLGNTPCISNDNLILGPQNAGRYSGVLLDLIVTGERSVTRLTDIDAVLDRVPARLETASGRHELINIETTLRLSVDLLLCDHGVGSARMRRLHAIHLLLAYIERRRDEMTIDEIRGLLLDAVDAMRDAVTEVTADTSAIRWSYPA